MIKKNEILKKFKVDSLSEIKDKDLISLAEEGELGSDTMYSAAKKWAFPNIHALAEFIREAINMEKELRVVITEGEFFSEDEIDILLV